MAYFGGVNFQYQANLNVQFGDFQRIPNPVQLMAQPDFSTQIVVQMLSQMMQALSQMQTQWSAFISGATQFYPPPTPTQPPSACVL